MTVFWSLAASMSLLALLFVVTPLLRKRPANTVDKDELNTEVARARLAELDMDLESGRLEQAQYDAARADLERELLYDLAGDRHSDRPVRNGSWAALLVAIAVPVGATLLYKAIGSEQIITLLQEFPAAARQVQQQASPQLSVEEMVGRLAARMESEPDNLKGWLMLAKSYTVLNRFEEAVPAYRNITRLGGGDNAGVLADFADALASSNNGRFTDEAGTLLTRALALEPDNLKALWLAGHWKNQSGDPAAAIAHWQQAASQMQPQSEDWRIITSQIEQVRQRAGLPASDVQPLAVAQAGESAPAAAKGGTVLQVTVALDPALQDRTRPDDTVFIFARAVNGPRMPLAIVRKQVKDLPVTVTLDDSLAMSPAMVLSGFDPVSVGARISKSGNAMPQSGDLQGTISPVSTGATASVEILIDSSVP